MWQPGEVVTSFPWERSARQWALFPLCCWFCQQWGGRSLSGAPRPAVLSDPPHSLLSCRMEPPMSKSAANSRSPIIVTEFQNAVTSGAGDATSGSKVSSSVNVPWEANQWNYLISNILKKARFRWHIFVRWTLKWPFSPLKDNIYMAQPTDLWH